MKELYLQKDSVNFEVDFNDALILELGPKEIVAYLKASHKSFENDILPTIYQHFLGLMRSIPNSKSLVIIFNSFSA